MANASFIEGLKKAINDMGAQEELYRPTSFWREASTNIVKELEAYGIENFRNMPIALGFFTPTYGHPGNSFSTQHIDDLTTALDNRRDDSEKARLGLAQFLSGESAAGADFRVLQAADQQDKKPYLHTFTESKFGNPKEHFEFEGRDFSRSSLNYLLGMAMLKKHLAGEYPKTVLEIGGGFGTLGEILLQSGIEDLKYIDVDIPPTSCVAQAYLSNAAGSDNVSSYEATQDLPVIEVDGLKTISVLNSWQIPKLQGQVDLFVNFISFQEMEPDIVQNYLNHVNRLEAKWILLRNMREGKQIRKTPDGLGVEQPIFGEDYIAMLPNYELVECSTSPFGYKTVDNFHSELILLKRTS